MASRLAKPVAVVRNDRPRPDAELLNIRRRITLQLVRSKEAVQQTRELLRRK
jgi:hypothetical protein